MSRVRNVLFNLIVLIASSNASARPLFDSAAIGTAVGSVPYLQTAGDLDGDGLDDLIVADSDGAAILLASPDSTFRRPPRLLMERTSRMAIARVTSDSIADLIVTLAGEPVVRIYRGRGDGTFDPPMDFPLRHDGNSMVVRDLNADGVADVAIPVVGTVQVSFASPDSILDSPRAVPVGHFIDGLVAGDIDADGDIDLVALDAAEGKFSILVNGGSGTFTPVWRPASGIRNLAAMGYLDGDAYMDLAIASNAGISTWRGSADGMLSTGTALGSGPWAIDAVAAADIDGDGIDEVISCARSFVVTHRGTPTGPAQSYDFFSAYHSAGPMVTGRFDGDFHADVCTLEPTATGGIPECDPSQGSLAYVWHGNATGGFARNTVLTTGDFVAGMVVADLDRDGDYDVVSSALSVPSIQTFRGRQDGSFESPVPTTLPSLRAMIPIEPVLGGPLQIAAAGGSAADGITPRILLLDVGSDGSLVTRQTIPCTEEPSALVAADFNRDGRMDLAATLYSGRAIRLFFSESDGHFVDGPVIGLPIRPQVLIAADLDRDGLFDLAVGGTMSFTEGSLLVMLGDGNGQFAVRDSVRTTYPVVALAVSAPEGADPLLAASANPPTCPGSVGSQMLFRSVDGALSMLGSSPERVTSSLRVAFADVDGDGRDDFLTTNAYGELSVRTGLPGGAFAEPTVFEAANPALTFSLADIDHDGRVDVFVGERWAIRVLRNVGANATPWITAAGRIAGGLPEAILLPGRERALPFLIAGDPDHDTRRIVPESVRLAGAPALRGRSRLHDEVRRLRPIDDACIPLANDADGFADLTITFSSADVVEGWRRMQPGFKHDPGGPQLVGLPWDARTVDGEIMEGVACALLLDGDEQGTPSMNSYGPDRRTDLGVGVTVDLPGAAAEAEVALFDISGRRVATLHRGALEAGFHRLPWNDAGARRGIYFAQARIDGVVLRTRVVVLR